MILWEKIIRNFRTLPVDIPTEAVRPPPGWVLHINGNTNNLKLEVINPFRGVNRKVVEEAVATVGDTRDSL